MSSDMKDARWEIAYILSGLVGKGFNDYDYEGWQFLLDLGQDFLNTLSEEEIRAIARKMEENQ